LCGVCSTPEGVRYVDVVVGKGEAPTAGCRVALAFSGRLAAKNGWTFATQTADEPFVFTLGDANVVPGLNIAVLRGMRVGGVRRVVLPPALGYVTEATQPVPAEFWQRRRLYSTVFNPTRLANGEGDTLATTVWDLQLLRVQCQP
jgi:FKBP-type peptidyl-prolyl cis-trans isomerase